MPDWLLKLSDFVSPVAALREQNNLLSLENSQLKSLTAGQLDELVSLKAQVEEFRKRIEELTDAKGDLEWQLANCEQHLREAHFREGQCQPEQQEHNPYENLR